MIRVICYSTREQKWSHLSEDFQRHNFEWVLIVVHDQSREGIVRDLVILTNFDDVYEVMLLHSILECLGHFICERSQGLILHEVKLHLLVLEQLTEG